MSVSMSNEAAAKESVRALKAVYKTRDGGLSKEFFATCLQYATSYDRAAGYFSSTVFKMWSEALLRIAQEDVSIRLLISPTLSTSDYEAIQKSLSNEEIAKVLDAASTKLVIDVINFVDNSENASARVELLVSLLVSKKLQIRFGLPIHEEDADIFHEKSGIFRFPWGDQVGFEGSANETESGYRRNYEKIHVFRSWMPGEDERIGSIRTDFEERWDGNDEGLIVCPMSEEAMKHVRLRDEEYAARKRQKTGSKLKKSRKWRHQDEAVDAFLAAGNGILEMATGTGKTNTALKIAEKLLAQHKIDSIILATDGNDLLDQWCDTFLEWGARSQYDLRILQHYKSHKESSSYTSSSSKAILIVSRDNLAPVLSQLPISRGKSTLIIQDEIHGLGSPARMEALQGLHEKVSYRLGLSATPVREYDAVGTDFIIGEIGPIRFSFGLKEAIERGILVEFDYVPLGYSLSDNDRARLKAVYNKKAAREREGFPMSKEELWTELSRVYKTAENKPSVFQEYLKEHTGVVKSSIVFVEEMGYGQRVLPMIHRVTPSYRTYYSGEDKQNLIAFSKGEIDCLITCHRISQGIDIQRLRNVILFSSARAKLETIQRIGRCLRFDPANPEKRALVVDFVRVEEYNTESESADTERAQWLEDLSKVKRLEYDDD